MRVLFYAELHPIRKSFIEHSWIVSELIRVIKHDTNFKIICNHKVKEKFKDSNLILNLIPQEQKTIESFFRKEWNDESIAEWKNLMLGNSDIYSKFYHGILDRIKREYPFDVIVYWGTNLTLKNYCDKLKIPCIAMELGCTRDPFFVKTTYFDLRGVNGASSLSGLSFEDISSKITTIDPSIVINETHGSKSLENVYLGRFWEPIYQNWGKNVLIPLQLDDDSNILLYTKYKNVFEFVKNNVEKLTAAGYCCYVKPHPGRKARAYNDSKHDEIEKYVDSVPNAYWVPNLGSPELMEKCNIIITINSSLAFESILKGKVVINEGLSCWNIKNVFPSLEDILNKKFNYNEYSIKIKKLASFILEYYLVPYSNAFHKNKFFEIISFLKKQYDEILKNSNLDLFKYPRSSSEDYLNVSDSYKIKKQVTNTRKISKKIILEEYSGKSTLGHISNKKNIIQEFVCYEKNMCQIQVNVGTYLESYEGNFLIYLVDVKTGKYIGDAAFDGRSIKDNSWLNLTFESIKNSENKKYRLHISAISYNSKNNITVFYNNLSNNKDCSLFINNTKMSGFLNMRIVAEVYS